MRNKPADYDLGIDEIMDEISELSKDLVDFDDCKNADELMAHLDSVNLLDGVFSGHGKGDPTIGQWIRAYRRQVDTFLSERNGSGMLFDDPYG